MVAAMECHSACALMQWRCVWLCLPSPPPPPPRGYNVINNLIGNKKYKKYKKNFVLTSHVRPFLRM